MTPSATAIVAAFATCPDGNEPKSDVTIMSSGRARPKRFFRSCTTPALAADATTKYSAAHGRLTTSNATAVTIGTTNTPITPPPSAFMR